jgi:hypothetical protein
MTCNDFDALLCDYLDGTLAADRRSLMDVHVAGCAECASLARDAREVMGLVERSADVEMPPEMVTRILQQVPRGGWLERVLGPVFQPIFQPRVVMGAMLTVLSLSMMTRCAGAPKHALTAADLDPVRLWTAFDDKTHRVWDRSVKSYESLKLVYEVQNRVNEWKQKQQEDEEESKRLPRTAAPHELPGKGKGDVK